MNISLLEPLGIPVEQIEKFGAVLKTQGHSFTYYDAKATDTDELIRRSRGQEIIMIANSPYPDEVIRSADRLRMIAVAFTGIDHVGLKACKEKEIIVCNCAGYSNQSVSELVIGMTISLYRKTLACDSATRNGRTSAGLVGCEIGGKTVGIIGCGHIGYRTAKLFQAFGAKVQAYSRRENPQHVAEDITYVDIDTLLQTSDIVSLHLPSTPQTKGFIDRDKLSRMKKSAVFINCARGPIVDTQALADILNEEKIAGAALDVFDMEPPLAADYPLCHSKNTLLAPHVAFLTSEAMVRRAEIEFDNVLSFLEGTPKNKCTL